MLSPRTLPSFIVAGIAAVLVSPSSAPAQAKDAFVAGLTQLIAAVENTNGDEAPLVAAIDAMARGLAEWDARVAGVESGLRAEIGAAPPPLAARMRATLGAVYLERGRVADALQQFEAAATLDPTLAEVHVLRGVAFELAGKATEAASAYASAWQAGAPTTARAYLYLRSRRASDARRALDARALLASALDAATSIEPRIRFSSASLLDEGSVAAPILPLTVYAEAFASIASGRFEDAIARLRIVAASDAMRAQARDERSRLARADALLDAGNPGAAADALRETLQVLPGCSLAQWKLGRLYQRMGNEAEALPLLEKIATLPVLAGRSHVLAAIGRLHHNRFDLEAAEAVYLRRLALHPNDSSSHYDLGEIYRAQDKLDEAFVEYAAAALLDPGSARAFAMIGQVHAAAGRDEAAVGMLRRAIAIDAAQLDARYGLSRALLRLGHVDDAQQELRVFEQMQAKAMEDERRRFLNNQQKLEDALNSR
jgi:protein O-GlcNAc transferase